MKDGLRTGECTSCAYSPYASKDKHRCQTCFGYTPLMKPVWKNYVQRKMIINNNCEGEVEMTNRQMAARSYLSRVRYMKQKADALERERAVLTKYTGDECTAVSEFKGIIAREQKECCEVINQTKEIIEQAGEAYYALLSYRYIGCMRWDEIENNLHISEGTRKTLHNQALDAVADILEKSDLF